MLCLSGFELSSRGCPCYVPHLKHVWKVMRPCRAISSFFFNKSLSDLAIVIFFWLSFQRCRQIITNSSLWQKLKKTNQKKKTVEGSIRPYKQQWQRWQWSLQGAPFSTKSLWRSILKKVITLGWRVLVKNVTYKYPPFTPRDLILHLL